MRSKFTITITDYHGARHFTLSQIVKQLAASVAAILLAILLLGTTAIIWLKHQVERLEVRRDEVTAINKQLENHNAALLTAIEEQTATLNDNRRDLRDSKAKLARAYEELEQISTGLEDIEEMIGLQPDPDVIMSVRLDTASQTALEKTLLLESIPKGAPVEELFITSGFGWRKTPRKQFHTGIDLRANKNTPVYTTADGLVETTGITRGKAYGKVVVVLHNYGFRTYYAHLEKILVKKGDYVRSGDQIALSGNSGRTTAPHVHYEIHHLENKLNPRPFVEWDLERYDSLFEQETRVQWDSLAALIKRRLENPAQLSSLQAPK